LRTSKQTKAFIEKGMELLFAACSFSAVIAVGLIIVYMLAMGGPAIAEIGPIQFLFGTTWTPASATDPQFGILPMILSSIFGTLGAILIGVPIGLLAAVFLANVASDRVAAAVRPVIELLAGIPSVIYGLIGMVVIVPTVAKVFSEQTQYNGGATMFSAILVLSVMVLPTIISVSETALRAVPKDYEQASLALGATQVQTIFQVLVPAARSGITAGIVLGIGRAIGEAMAILLVSGNVVNMPGLFSSVRFLTTGIVSEMGYAEGLHRQALFGIGLVLFVFIMGINIALYFFVKKGVGSKDGK